MTDIARNVTTYTYDKASRMETVTFDGGKLTYQYDENGKRLSITYGNGVKELYEYNKDNEIISLVNKKSGGSEISRYSYTYDAAGRQVTKTDSYGTTNYTYDKAGRILKVDGPGKIDIYAYDGAGNRIAVNETYKSLQPSGFVDDATGNDVQYILKKTDYTYSNAGKMLKLVERMYDDSNKEVLRKTVNYYYDSNGNELSNTASWTHPHDIKLRQSTTGALNGENTKGGTDPLIDRVNNTFDGFDRLVKVERISAGVRSISEYLYNGDNLRVSKTVKKSSDGYKEEVTNYLYDRQNVILETDAKDKVKTRYVKGINYIASLSASNKISYFLFNGHGDVVQTVDKTGEVLNHYDYDIWGNPILTVEIEESAIRYAGEFYDSETGLYYLRARYYDSTIARFISEDTYQGEQNDPLSLNLYTYCNNNPIKYIDPTGHKAGSVVDYLKAQKEDSSYAARKEIAKDLGIKNYTGTAAQNTQMLKKLQVQDASVKETIKETVKEATKETTYETKSTIKPLNKVFNEIIDGSKYKDYSHDPVMYSRPTGNKKEEVKDPNAELFKNLNSLNDLALNYTKGDVQKANQLVLQYVRHDVYDSSTWDTVAGKIDDKFVKYVDKKDKKLTNLFDGAVNMIDPKSGEKIDFTHMAATLNANIYNSKGAKPMIVGEKNINNLAGWAGDLQTSIKDVQHDTNNSNNYDTLYKSAIEIIGSDSKESSFGIADLLADVDAVNIADKSSKKTSIVDTIQSYYSSDKQLSYRYTNFVKNLTSQTNESTLASLAWNYTNENFAPYVKWPLLEDVEVKFNQSRAISDAFANVIFMNVKEENKPKK